MGLPKNGPEGRIDSSAIGVVSAFDLAHVVRSNHFQDYCSPNTINVRRLGVKLLQHIFASQLTECTMLHPQELEGLVDPR